jgi:hypothetical protein
MNEPSWRDWIGVALVVAGLARAALLISHDPMLGYANQYDMHRTGACIGLYPAIEEPARSEATRDAPIALYRGEAARRGNCYASSEVLIAAAVTATARALRIDGGGFRLQWLGYAKLGLLAITALLIAWALHHHPAAALLHGLIVLLVLADPIVTLWFNTLYTEFAVIWGLYAAIGAACALALSERITIALWQVLLVGLVALAFSREQWAYLAPLLVLIAWPWLWYRSKPMTVTTLVVALFACLVSSSVLPRPGVVRHMNRADTYLGVVIPASSNPTRALEVLALPARCEAMVGATWNHQRGENVQAACPEVFSLSSFAFLRFAKEEPEVIARSLARVLPAVQALVPEELGALEGGKRVPAGALPTWVAYSPLLALTAHLPGLAFVTLAIAVFLLAPLALLVALAWARPSRVEIGTPKLLAMLLAGTALYAWITTVFGDGLGEAGRNFLAGSLAIHCAILSVIVGIPVLVVHWVKAPRQGALQMVAGIAAAAVIVLAIVMTLRWADTEPLAIGALDAPKARQVPAGGVQLLGWALDPFGVESVAVELGSLRRAARIGQASPATLPAAYPGYPDAARAGFVADLTAEDLAKAGPANDLPLRVTVKSKTGAVTEVDRRRLELAP